MKPLEYTHSGYIEKANIYDDGKLIFRGKAKLDTGNGINSSLHAENIEVHGEGNNRTVSFTINGKRFTKPLIKLTTVKKHQGRFEEERYKVRFDSLKIGDKEVRDFDVTLTTRDKEPLLLNRDIISKMKLSIIADRQGLIANTYTGKKSRDYEEHGMRESTSDRLLNKILNEKIDPEIENYLDVFIDRLKTFKEELEDEYFMKTASKNKMKIIENMLKNLHTKIFNSGPEKIRTIKG